MSLAPDPDRCTACGLRPTFVAESLCETCEQWVQKGGCELCGMSHGRQITCAEAEHRAEGPDNAGEWPWQPRSSWVPFSPIDRAADEWAS